MTGIFNRPFNMLFVDRSSLSMSHSPIENMNKFCIMTIMAITSMSASPKANMIKGIP
nr:hypothetical protein [Candidatus Sigynarchaeota archaeon]